MNFFFLFLVQVGGEGTSWGGRHKCWIVHYLHFSWRIGQNGEPDLICYLASNFSSWPFIGTVLFYFFFSSPISVCLCARIWEERSAKTPCALERGYSRSPFLSLFFWHRFALAWGGCFRSRHAVHAVIPPGLASIHHVCRKISCHAVMGHASYKMKQLSKTEGEWQSHVMDTYLTRCIRAVGVAIALAWCFSYEGTAERRIRFDHSEHILSPCSGVVGLK